MNVLLPIAGFLLIGSSIAVAAPTVTGNTISWPDDGWYQVQAVTDEGISEVCAGTRECEVPVGSYIVINHTTGERFENVVVDDENTVSEVTVTGNTISWPDDGWYQVQAVTDEGITEVCAGTRECEVPVGSYIVINHTTGERFEDVVVGDEISVSEITVKGNTISWPDDGWYQVQAVTDEGITEVCAGTRECEVPDGNYIVINHSTGERHEPVLVNAGSTDPEPVDLPIIRAETWQQVLRNVVALINADSAIARHDMVLDNVASLSQSVIDESFGGDTSGTVASLGLTRLPQTDPENENLVDYSCDAGGDMQLLLTPGVSVYSVMTNNCAIAGDVYDGDFEHNGVGREGFFSQMGGLSVNLSDSTHYSLSGTHRTSYDRVGIRRSIQWDNASMTDQSEGADYSVEEFSMTSESADGVNFQQSSESVMYADGTEGTAEEYFHSAAVTGSFSVSAPWTDNKVMQVTSDLKLGGILLVTDTVRDMPTPYATTSGPSVWPLAEPGALPSQWSSGSIEVVAEDGSRLSLRPMPDDSTRALVEVSDISEPQQVFWNEGNQVRCFGDSGTFANCQ